MESFEACIWRRHRLLWTLRTYNSSRKTIGGQEPKHTETGLTVPTKFEFNITLILKAIHSVIRYTLYLIKQPWCSYLLLELICFKVVQRNFDCRLGCCCLFLASFINTNPSHRIFSFFQTLILSCHVISRLVVCFINQLYLIKWPLSVMYNV